MTGKEFAVRMFEFFGEACAQAVKTPSSKLAMVIGTGGLTVSSFLSATDDMDGELPAELVKEAEQIMSIGRDIVLEAAEGRGLEHIPGFIDHKGHEGF